MSTVGAMYALLAALAAPTAATVFSAAGRRVGKVASVTAAAAVVVAALLATPGTPRGELLATRETALGLLGVALAYLVAALGLEPSLEEAGRGKARLYLIAFNAAFATMMIAMSTNNMFVMWVFLEISTLLTVYLTALPEKAAAEAAWKYLIICGVGMSFSLYGLVLTYSIAASHGVKEAWLLSSINPGVLENAGRLAALAAVMTVTGFMIKSGLLPAYMWLPSAHAEAPYPVSALLSGALTYAAVFDLARLLHMYSWLRDVLWLVAVLSLISVLIGAAGIAHNTDIKRVLAYSSIEHMGLLALFASAYYASGSRAALLAFNVHATGHAVAKAAAFVAAGTLAYMARTRDLRRLDPRRDRVLGWGLFGLIVALAAMPPFPLFYSEFVGVLALDFSAALLAAYIAVCFAAFAALTKSMLTYYEAKEDNGSTRPGDYKGAKLATIAALLILIALTVAALLVPRFFEPSSML